MALSAAELELLSALPAATFHLHQPAAFARAVGRLPYEFFLSFLFSVHCVFLYGSYTALWGALLFAYNAWYGPHHPDNGSDGGAQRRKQLLNWLLYSTNEQRITEAARQRYPRLDQVNKKDFESYFVFNDGYAHDRIELQRFAHVKDSVQHAVGSEASMQPAPGTCPSAFRVFLEADERRRFWIANYETAAERMSDASLLDADRAVGDDNQPLDISEEYYQLSKANPPLVPRGQRL